MLRRTSTAPAFKIVDCRLGKASRLANVNNRNYYAAGARPKSRRPRQCGKRSFETNTKAMEKLFGVKSLDKAIEVQSEYAKAMYEDYTAQATKLGELYADLAKEAFKPYASQVAKMPSAK
jgi:hypothetical protein